MSIRDYAIYKNISVQTVYTHIKKDLLEAVTKEGKKFIKVDREELEEDGGSSSKAPLNPFKTSLNNIKKSLKPLLKQIKNKDKTIDLLYAKLEEKDETISKLYKKLEKCGKSKEKVLLSYIQEMKQFQLEHKPNSKDEVIDVDIKPKKRKPKK